MSSFYEYLERSQRDYAVSSSYRRPVRNSGPTPRQVETYLNMCHDRLLKPVNYTNFTINEMSQEIDRIKSLRSRAQIDKIYEKIDFIKSLGINLDTFLMNVNFDELTGGRDGTASKLIEELFAIEKECNVMLPPTDEQLDQITGWMLCPDIPFEDFNIKRTKDLGDGFWRRLTPEEFRTECAKNMKRNQASKLIDDFRGTFFEWRKSRISKAKMDYIRRLESRLVSVYIPKEDVISVDINGDRVTSVKHKVTDKTKTYDPTAFVPLTDDELFMFSDDDAEYYIDILKAESRRRYYANKTSDEELTFEELRTNADENTIQADQKAGSVEAACTKEFIALQDAIFKLESVGGYENSEAHDAISSLLTSDGFDSKTITEAKLNLRSYMLYLVDEGFITLQGLVELIKDSQLLTDLLIGRVV